MKKMTNFFVSVIMPCLNEEKTVGGCVKKAFLGLKKAKVKGEVIVVDNGSEDSSPQKAEKAGAKVILETKKGYGQALLTGLKSAKGEILVFADSDGTYDFREIPKLIAPLTHGYDLVLGSRLKGKIKKGAMPFLNRFFGTPTLNLFLRLFYGLKVSDSQTGMRALTKKAFKKMRLFCLGMEFASEMLIRASQEKLKIKEVPIVYYPRQTPSKLSRFRDAWRHIRFMLLFAPTWLFLFPGMILMVVGGLGVLSLLRGPVFLFGRGFDFHTMIFASMLVLVGYQVIMLGIFAKVFSWTEGLAKDSLLTPIVFRYFRLEKGLLLGVLILLIGLLVGGITFFNWAKQGFGELWAIRPTIFSMMLIVLGIQIIFSSFFLSILGVDRHLDLSHLRGGRK
ncbi:MAG: glycosyltransferase family 2 protein [Microgenomates group bacterium]